MAAGKTLELLVGVVLVLRCVGSIHAEVTAGDGKRLTHKPDTRVKLLHRSVLKWVTCRKTGEKDADAGGEVVSSRVDSS